MAVPAAAERIEIRVRHLQQLFNLIDPSPFHDRDLDPAADEFIESWARTLPTGVPLALLVYVDEPSTQSSDIEVLRDSVQQFYRRKADAASRRLRDLFRRGRISLLIAVLFLATLGVIANTLAGVLHGTVGAIAREGLLIVGWVAMWRPLEIFLYDWWPIRAKRKLFDRLAAMPVSVQYR